jgi:hypothetical protein
MENNQPWKRNLLGFVKHMVSQVEESSPGATWVKDRMSHCITHNFYGSDIDKWNGELAEEEYVFEGSRLLYDMPTGQCEEFLHFLAYHFPHEAHFGAHYGRYLYNNAPHEEEEEEKIFQKARDELDRVLQIDDRDATIIHMRGMCPRRFVKRLLDRYGIRQDAASYPKILKLVDEARSFFEKARMLNPADEHSYASEIELLRDLVNYGTRRVNDKVRLLAERDDLRDWLYNAFRLLRQAEERLLIRGSQYFRKIRGDLERLQGNYERAISAYQEAVRQLRGGAGTLDLKYQIASLRYNHVIKSLMTDGQKLKIEDLQQARKELEFVLQERNDERSLELWFKVYTLLPDYSPETAESFLLRLYQITNGGLEAAFGLMCIWFIRAAQGNILAYRRLIEYRARSAEMAQRLPSLSYVKYWLGSNWRLIPDRLVQRLESDKDERDLSGLMRLSGYVCEYRRPTIGKLRIGEGEVEVIFQPGRRPSGQLPFTQNDAENRTKVSCVISFTYDHPRAYDTMRDI